MKNFKLERYSLTLLVFTCILLGFLSNLTVKYNEFYHYFDSMGSLFLGSIPR